MGMGHRGPRPRTSRAGTSRPSVTSFWPPFDATGRALRCAADIVDAARDLGLALRAGGPHRRRRNPWRDVVGIAVHTANRISSLADPSEILVSRTVVDLTAGSGLQFEPRGEHQLKGVPGNWPTFAAVPSS